MSYNYIVQKSYINKCKNSINFTLKNDNQNQKFQQRVGKIRMPLQKCEGLETKICQKE
ncbi:unnamed protein product [Paramecium primaurelia]|uniref:Uncharacterized protein n=1 Tax=Paramecium primaurelia TaxID=5886 RepID=A0A8S1MEV6_PARPR|nr:unnamed protein product [Paramecium primaurelia]